MFFLFSFQSLLHDLLVLLPPEKSLSGVLFLSLASCFIKSFSPVSGMFTGPHTEARNSEREAPGMFESCTLEQTFPFPPTCKCKDVAYVSVHGWRKKFSGKGEKSIYADSSKNHMFPPGVLGEKAQQTEKSFHRLGISFY